MAKKPHKNKLSRVLKAVKPLALGVLTQLAIKLVVEFLLRVLGVK